VETLEGQVAVVVGLEGSAARAVARALAESGANVAIAADGADAQQAVADVDALGRRGLALSGDISGGDECRKAISEVLSTLGRLDVVVSGVGLGSVERNCDGMLLLSRALIGADQQLRWSNRAPLPAAV
jgi:NAD(P)-dependent dehydrogenase (short-subunit alcohol dehydrogenase family)